MRYSRLSRIFLPRDDSARTALPGGLAVLVALAALDLLLGEDFRLHALYLFPFTYIAIHCANAGTAIFAGAVTFGLQTAVLLLYPIPLHTKVVSSLVSLSIVYLTGGLARALRNTLRTTYHDATHDTLTGLQNRRSFDDFLAAEIARRKRFGSCFSLLLLDLDRFKELNDTHGHASGDNALRQTAQTLKQHTRETDVVARLGGDEFVVLLPNTSLSDCAAVSAHISQGIADAMTEAGYAVTASIGSQTFETPPETPASALRLADEALYAAKAGGRNRCVNR